MLSNEEISAIKGRVEKATEGSWECADTTDGVWVLDEVGDIITGTCSRKVDGEFIAIVRDDVPKLLAEIERLRDFIRGGEHACHMCGDYYYVNFDAEGDLRYCGDCKEAEKWRYFNK